MGRRVFWPVLLAVWACDDEFGTPSSPLLDTTTFEVRVRNVGPVFPVRSVVVFEQAVDAPTAGPIGGGGRYVREVLAAPGDRLSFATGFYESNDWFYAFAPEGLPLYDAAGAALQGDLTGRVVLWDAGTEANQRPGAGDDQPPRQPAPDSGSSTDLPVAPVTDAVSFGDLAPPVREVIRVSLTYLGEARFRLTVEDVSDEDTLALPDGEGRDVRLSPGVVVVHDDTFTLFDPDGASRGLERLAEDGDPRPLAAALAPLEGTTVALSPGIWAVHRPSAPLFRAGVPATEALERLAEDGDPDPLDRALDDTAGVVRHGTFEARLDGVGPTLPGDRHVFLVDVARGERLAVATMYAPSNDWFYATPPVGVPLFDLDGTPLGIELPVGLWDAGTEVDQPLGVGDDQGALQPGPDVGEDEDGVITPVPAGADPLQGARVRVSVRPF